MPMTKLQKLLTAQDEIREFLQDQPEDGLAGVRWMSRELDQTFAAHGLEWDPAAKAWVKASQSDEGYITLHQMIAWIGHQVNPGSPQSPFDSA